MSKKKERGQTVSETLRKAIENSDLTLYRVAKDAGIGYATLHRFMHGERAVSMEVLDKLCWYMELELRPTT